MADLETDNPRILGPVANWSLAVGGVLALLGLLSLAAPWAAATVIDAFCGVTLVAAGIAQVALAAGTFTRRGFWLTLLCGALSIMGGAAMLVLPKAGIEALVVFLGLILLLEAAAKLTAATTMRSELGGEFPWGWLLFDGLVTGVLAGLLLTTKPAAAGILLGVFVGVNLLSSGLLFTTTGLWLRREVAHLHG